ncbi:TFPI1 inhibitor, partial [Polyodon spathula]|nr:TFPI1 inhibitor [Polyodon spathula]
MDEGPCKSIQPKFYFDIDTQKCEPFDYGGCQGNENRFNTLADCEKMCLVQRGKDPCQLEEEPGPCRLIVIRYFFSTISQKCEPFMYGGCLGNANNFRTLKQCQDSCHHKSKALFIIHVLYISSIQKQIFIFELAYQSLVFTERITHSHCRKFFVSNLLPKKAVLTVYLSFSGNLMASAQSLMKLSLLLETSLELKKKQKKQKTPPLWCCIAALNVPDFCLTPAEEGPCAASVKRYFYSSTQEKCQQFVYSGCGGNNNNFISMTDCRRTCMKGV